MKDNLLGVFDADSKRIQSEFKKKYGLDILPPQKILSLKPDIILSTAVGRIKDVLLSVEKYTLNLKNIFFLDDFFDAENFSFN
ncbi:hypothetical protein J7L67_09350 [bacterium]|nr:hypothetical protein [bacterium]